jgi:DNA-binding MarR family transcriptional regulator
MSNQSNKREELLRELMKRFQAQSTTAILLHQAIADRLGLNVTDHKCLSIILESQKPITPRDLANITGLTTGAITGIVDRLEKAGFIRRQRDNQDRRSLTLHPIDERVKEIFQIFEPFSEATREFLSRYNNDELTLILDLVNKLIDLSEKEIHNLRTASLDEI